MNFSLDHFIRRVFSVMLSPSSAWGDILLEKDTVQDLYRYYILPLSVIPGISAFGASLITDRSIFISNLIYALCIWTMTFSFPALSALIIEKVSVMLGGVCTPIAALKLTAYSLTAWCLASLCFLLPAGLSQLATFFTFYGLYIFFTGIPHATQLSEERLFAFFSFSLLGTCIIVLFNLAVLSALRSAII